MRHRAGPVHGPGSRAQDSALADRGIPGAGHFAMLETSRRQVFDLIAGWVDGVVA